MELCTGDLSFLNANGQISIRLYTLLLSSYQPHHNMKKCIYHPEIYKQYETRGTQNF